MHLPKNLQDDNGDAEMDSNADFWIGAWVTTIDKLDMFKQLKTEYSTSTVHSILYTLIISYKSNPRTQSDFHFISK